MRKSKKYKAINVVLSIEEIQEGRPYIWHGGYLNGTFIRNWSYAFLLGQINSGRLYHAGENK